MIFSHVLYQLSYLGMDHLASCQSKAADRRAEQRL